MDSISQIVAAAAVAVAPAAPAAAAAAEELTYCNTQMLQDCVLSS